MKDVNRLRLAMRGFGAAALGAGFAALLTLGLGIFADFEEPDSGPVIASAAAFPASDEQLASMTDDMLAQTEPAAGDGKN